MAETRRARRADRGWAVGLACLAMLAVAWAGCGRGPAGAPAPVMVPPHLLIVTIDTLRADRLGAYGYAAARTPAFDGVAARGVRFDRAFSTAPITLPAHASIMTGRYPPGHGARHNGMTLSPQVPTLAATLRAAGFATAAFVGAFPLDRRFGLNRGFDAYGDRMPRDADGRAANERPGHDVVTEALGWMSAHRAARMFLWVHLFEPHAPYGAASDGRPVAARYDDEIAESDRQLGRLLEALGPERDRTVVVVAGDHGEAFGEHGEIGHSIFVYDTTLRVPLVIAGPSLPPGVVRADVSLIDIAPTVAALLGVGAFAADGVDLGGLALGGPPPARALYAESFAPLLDFGWSPLRALREGGFKYIAAPRPELFDLERDPDEGTNVVAASPARAAPLAAQVARMSPPSLIGPAPAVDADATRRLQALGYTAGARSAGPSEQLADPKDRQAIATRLAQVTSGEVSGAALEATLRQVLAEDPQNPQAHLRLGYELAGSNRCREAEAHFRAVIDARTPTADAHLGLAGCLTSRRAFAAAGAVLTDAVTVEPDNPVVVANRGVLLSNTGQPEAAIPLLRQALALDPEALQTRFYLAVALAKAGQREGAATEARALLAQLPPGAPQRSEVERLLRAVQ